MNENFAQKASLLSDETLQKRITERKKQVPEATEAWVAELQKRGHVFTDDELDSIRQDIAASREREAYRLEQFDVNKYSYDHKKVIVNDPAAPGFYSRRAIWGFSLFCGCLFGSVLLAINIGKTKNTKGVVWTLLFGVAFTALQVFVTESLNSRNSAAYLWGSVGGLILDVFFWKKFIGNNTVYRARPIWGPLIVAAAFLGLLILAIVFNQ